MYELEEAGVLRPPPSSTRCATGPRARRQQTSGGHVGRNYILNGYRQIFPARTTRSS